MDKLEFVSYDGKYPNLCSGTLVLRLNGKDISFKEGSLSSGGWANCRDGIGKGSWTIDEFPKEFKESEMLRVYANYLVNQNIKEGCCGGCL